MSNIMVQTVLQYDMLNFHEFWKYEWTYGVLLNIITLIKKIKNSYHQLMQCK